MISQQSKKNYGLIRDWVSILSYPKKGKQNNNQDGNMLVIDIPMSTERAQ